MAVEEMMKVKKKMEEMMERAGEIAMLCVALSFVYGIAWVSQYMLYRWGLCGNNLLFSLEFQEWHWWLEKKNSGIRILSF